ncbi:hypothetical protein K5X82_04800 [Halosquirtibacter xylanolyticus]|uniref:hypothetical protein n=1 Tax=Halosquirtibacter xylanolyticus TaxID=3374599 RepID=UPI003748A6C6|nr:hypothetical protein K5X82_04800 [Prolixibacteraceae bacterium]
MNKEEVYHIVERFHHTVVYDGAQISFIDVEEQKGAIGQLIVSLRSVSLNAVDCMYDRFRIWSFIFDGLHRIIKKIWSPDDNYIRYRWMTDHHHWFISDLPFTLKDIYEGVLGHQINKSGKYRIDYFSFNDPRRQMICLFQCENRREEGVCYTRRNSIGVLNKANQCVYNLPQLISKDYYYQMSRFDSMFDAVVKDVYQKLSKGYASLFFMLRF